VSVADDTRSAIGDRREQVKSFDRPERLNQGLSIKDAVSEVRETADLWKVYRPEWLVKFTSTKAGDEGRAECGAFFMTKYAERVRDEDVEYVPSSTVSPSDWPWRLWVRLPNVKGEFKHRKDAEEFASHWSDAEVVSRNSRDDYRLREYGTKKLTAAQRA
jgi:hypothetical protein